ncbi:hypothetical protein ACLB2K_035428 [Fragaria x ananassa]
MGAAGKTKDNLRSRRDLEAMGIRKQYHVKEREDGTKYFEPADFEMKNYGKDKFLLALSQSRMPDGSASNIARYLLTLKQYVRQRADPEASIANGYLMEGCMNFCSQYLKDMGNDRVRDELFILASQAHQVWYISDPSGEGWLNVSEVESKDFSHVQFDTSDEMELVVTMLGKKRKVGRPCHMSEFLSPSGSTSSHNGSSSSQSSYTFIRPPLIPPTPLPSPPQPTPPSTLPLPAPDAQPQATSNIVSRGHNKGIPEWNTGENVNIMFDSKFQPVGERATQLNSQLGKIVRDGRRIPLTIMDWKSVDKKVKEGIWNEVKTNLVDVLEGYKPVCLKSCNYLWKDHKSKTKSNYFVPNKSNPKLSSMVPPNIIADQWTMLVAYWNTEDTKAIVTRNSINRETRGPSHNTGRKNFAQLRSEMEQSGEESNKFSVWKKARKESNPEVAQVINEYNRKLLLVRPVEDQKLTAIKDRVFHDVIGEDGHGYCRTYGSTVPRNTYGYCRTLGTASSNDLIAKITEKVTEKLKESFDKKLEDVIKMLQAQIANNMDCTIAQGGKKHNCTWTG